MQQVIQKLTSNISITPQEFHLQPEIFGGEEQQSPAPSPANGGGKSSPRRRKKRFAEFNHWIRKKVDKLSVQLRPVPVKPLFLDIGVHKSLLVQLGLWDFLNFRFDGEIRRDMLTELVASYKYHRELYKGVGYVHGLGISLNRGEVAKALYLPVERIHEKAKMVFASKDESLFIQKLFWDWIILKDDGDDKKMKYVFEFAKELKNSRFEKADWASLIWFMLERELKKGGNLVNCYYSSHLQALVKHQRPELFEDDQGGEVVGSADKSSGEEVVDVGNGVESGLNASFLMKRCKRERRFLDEDVVVVVDGEGDRLRKLHCSDLTGREFGGDYLVNEGVCQSDTVDSLEKKEEFLLHLQNQAQPEKIGESSTDFSGGKVGCLVVDLSCFAGGEFMDDDQLKEGGILEGVCPGDVVDSLENRVNALPNLQNQPQPEKIGEGSTDFSGGKVGCLVVDLSCFAGGEFMDDDQLKEGGILEGVCPGDVVDSLENRVNALPNLQANVDKETFASGCEMEDEINEAEYKTSTVEKEDVIQSEANEEVKEDKESEEESGVKEVKESEASSEAEVGISLAVRCVNEAGRTEDKENKYSVKREAKLEQDQHQPELRVENSTDDDGESLADLAGGEVDRQEVDLSCLRVDVGRDVDSVASVDLFAQEVCDRVVNKEGLTDDFVCQEREKQPADMGDDSMATLVNQPREAKLGDLLGDKEQELHMVQDQHQPEPEFENAAVENGESLEYQPVNMGSCQDNGGKELVLEISKEDDEHLFLPKTVEELISLGMESGGTVDAAMATLVNHANEAKIGSSHGNEEMKFHKVQDQRQPEIELEKATEKKAESLADFAGGEVNCPEVDLNCPGDNTGKGVDPVVSVDLFAEEVNDKMAKKEGSSDGLVCQEVDNHPADMEDDAVANLVNPAREANIGDLLGDKQQRLHMVQDQHQPELGSENATEENGETLESQTVKVSGKEFVFEISKKEDEHFFLQKNVDVEMDSGGTEDDAMVTSVNQTSEVRLGNEEKMKIPKIQVQHQPELGLENATEENGETLENQTVDASAKEFVLEILKEEDEHLLLQENVDVEMDSGRTEDDAMATAVNQTSEVKLGNEEKMKFPKIQEQIQPKPKGNGENFADFAGGKDNRQGTRRDVDSVLSVDLFAQEVGYKKAKMEGSTDGLVCQELENQPVDMECDAVANLVNPAHEGNVGDLLGDKQQKLHMVQDQHQPELGLENANEENGESLENQTLDVSAREFVLEIAKEDEEHLFLPEKVDVEMDSGGTEDDAMTTAVNQTSEEKLGNEEKMLFPKIQDQHQPALGLDNATEENGEALGNHTVDVSAKEFLLEISKEEDEHFFLQKNVDVEMDSGGTEDDAMATAVNQTSEVKLGVQSKLELDNASEKSGESLGDFAGSEVECLGVELNCMGNNSGNEVDPIASVDLLAEVVHDKEAKKERSTDGLFCQEIENQPADMEDDAVATLLPMDQDQPERGLEIATKKNGEGLADLTGKEGLNGDLVFQEVENQNVDAGSCQDNSGNDVVLEEISDQEEDEQLLLPKRVGEPFDMEIDSDGTKLQLTQTQSNKEDEAMPTLVNQAPEQKFHEVQIVLSDEECQKPFQRLETDEGKFDLLLQANGNASRSYTPLGQFPFEADTDNTVGTSEEHDEDSMDLDLFAEKMKSLTARFLDSARRKLEEKHMSNSMLQKKIRNQSQMIQQYELMLQKEMQQKQQYDQMLQMERQQKQKSNLKYERELHLMGKVLEDYRKAIKETNNSFAKYRERIQLPEEPLYMPHPDGGGEVILVSQWKKLEEERQKMAIEALVEEFEEVIMKNMKQLLSVLETYCERLDDLEQTARTMRGRF